MSQHDSKGHDLRAQLLLEARAVASVDRALTEWERDRDRFRERLSEFDRRHRRMTYRSTR